MGIMDKLGFGGSSSGNSTPGSGNTSLQESLEQFLKSPKVEDAKVKMNEAMTKAKETASSVAKKAEDCKVVIRGIRRDEIEKFKAMKKKSEITEDDLKNTEKEIQDIIDAQIKEIDKLADKKNKEIMEI